MTGGQEINPYQSPSVVKGSPHDDDKFIIDQAGDIEFKTFDELEATPSIGFEGRGFFRTRIFRSIAPAAVVSGGLAGIGVVGFLDGESVLSSILLAGIAIVPLVTVSIVLLLQYGSGFKPNLSELRAAERGLGRRIICTENEPPIHAWRDFVGYRQTRMSIYLRFENPRRNVRFINQLRPGSEHWLTFVLVLKTKYARGDGAG